MKLNKMKSLSVFFLAVLLIQATTGRPADDDEYEERQEHSFVFSSATNPGQLQTTQIIKSPSFTPLNFRLEQPTQQSFGSLFSSGFPSLYSFPGFIPIGQLSSGGFGGSGGQSFKLQYPGGFGQISGFSSPGSDKGSSSAFAQSFASPGSSSGQIFFKPGGLTFTQTSTSSPVSSQVSVTTQSSILDDDKASDGDEEPSIAVEF